MSWASVLEVLKVVKALKDSVHIFFTLTFYCNVGHEKLIYQDGHNMTHRLL